MNIKDIARQAGVSVATVSRVINNSESVKTEVRERIEKIITENNYVPNTVGISLRNKKSNTVGIVLPNIHSFYTERFNAITAYCTEKGYDNLVVVTSYSEAQEIKALAQFLKKQVDGVIFMTTALTENHRPVLDKYLNKCPIIVLDADASEWGFSSIVEDHYEGAKLAMTYLIEKGHRNIAFISGEQSLSADTSSRYKAYSEAMGNYEEMVVFGNYSLKSGYEAIDKLLKQFEHRFTAIYAANDSMAIGASRRLHELGLKIPEDVSLIGTDDIELLKYTCPAKITSVKQSLETSGRMAIEMLIERIENGACEVEKRVMKQSLIERESVKAIQREGDDERQRP